MCGTVSVLRRYPVKSMLGEDISVSEVTERGFHGDRGLALVQQETRQVASAKNPHRWRALLMFRAAIADSAVRITFPDGHTALSTDPDIDAVLSKTLDQPVTLTNTPPPDATLERSKPDQILLDGLAAQVDMDISPLATAAPENTFFDFAPIHLVTTATLRHIGTLSSRGAVEPDRYRPNLVIDTAGEGFEENDWPGRELHIGDELVLRVIARSPRCAVPAQQHGDLPRDADALRVAVTHNRVPPLDDATNLMPCAGAYCQVVRPGTIRKDDAVRLV